MNVLPRNIRRRCSPAAQSRSHLKFETVARAGGTSALLDAIQQRGGLPLADRINAGDVIVPPLAQSVPVLIFRVCA